MQGAYGAVDYVLKEDVLKKVGIITFILLLACVAAIAAQETALGMDTGGKQLFAFSMYGEAIWAPFVYKGGNTDVSEMQGAGAGMGVGASGWGGNGAMVGFMVTGQSPNGAIGAELRMSPQVSDGTFRVLDNDAYIWIRPFDMLKVQFGMYRWDDIRGQVGHSDSPAGGYGATEDDIFQHVQSNSYGTLIFLMPPSTAPDAIKGLKLFGSFGVSGWLDTNSPASYAARSGKLAEYIFSTPHAGLAYRNEAFGMARFQFIGSTYKWGQGTDWATITTPSNYNTVKETHGYFPGNASEAARMEFAVNVTRIPNMNLDIGFGIPFPVTVVAKDNGTTDRGMPVGPTYLDAGSRQLFGWANTNYLADTVGDKWQPPMKIALALDYKMDELGLGAVLRGKMEFGEQIAFAKGFPNYKGGLQYEVSLEPRYTIMDIGIVSLNLAVKVQQNSTFEGKDISFDTYNTMNTYSISHNGTVDAGLGLFFTRMLFGNSSYVKVGVCANLPVGGDRYNWSTDTVTDTAGDRLTKQYAQAFMKTNLIVMIPVIAEISF